MRMNISPQLSPPKQTSKLPTSDSSPVGYNFIINAEKMKNNRLSFNFPLTKDTTIQSQEYNHLHVTPKSY